MIGIVQRQAAVELPEPDIFRRLPADAQHRLDHIGADGLHLPVALVFQCHIEEFCAPRVGYRHAHLRRKVPRAPLPAGLRRGKEGARAVHQVVNLLPQLQQQAFAVVARGDVVAPGTELAFAGVLPPGVAEARVLHEAPERRVRQHVGEGQRRHPLDAEALPEVGPAHHVEPVGVLRDLRRLGVQDGRGPPLGRGGLPRVGRGVAGGGPEGGEHLPGDLPRNPVHALRKRILRRAKHAEVEFQPVQPHDRPELQIGRQPRPVRLGVPVVEDDGPVARNPQRPERVLPAGVLREGGPRRIAAVRAEEHLRQQPQTEPRGHRIAHERRGRGGRTLLPRGREVARALGERRPAGEQQRHRRLPARRDGEGQAEGAAAVGRGGLAAEGQRVEMQQVLEPLGIGGHLLPAQAAVERDPFREPRRKE